MRPEGLSQRKFPMTLLGIEPATFRLVAQCLLVCDINVRTSSADVREETQENIWTLEDRTGG